MKDLVYADYAAATPTDPSVAAKVRNVSINVIGNPSSSHEFGRAAQAELTQSKKTVATFIGAQPKDIYFTSCGTESNNLAVIGVARANRQKGQHIITTRIEHLSILNACRALNKDGWKVTYLPVDHDGLLNLEELKNALTAQTVLITTHFGNSEIGICQNIEEISKLTRETGVLLHIDACQAIAYLPFDVEKMGVDLLTFNGSKMYGPKGVAVLYVRDGVPIFPILYGGGQQQSLRSGTENVPAIVGLAAAAEITRKRLSKFGQIQALRDELEQGMEKIGLKINAKHPSRLPNHLSVTFPKFQGANIVEAFDQLGIAVSSGSACSSATFADSHVLASIGLSSKEINRTVRITLGWPTTKDEVGRIIKVAQKLSA